MNPDEMLALLEAQIFHWSYTRWVTREVFSLPWWGIVCLLLVMYIAWWKLVDKSRLAEILLFGSMVAVFSGGVDIVGTSTNLWTYKIRLLPIEPGPFPFDFTSAPILYMLAYQYTNSWSRYLVANAIASGLFGFVLLPIFQEIGVLQFIRWNYGYGFLLAMLMGVCVRFTQLAILKTTEKAQGYKVRKKQKRPR